MFKDWITLFAGQITIQIEDGLVAIYPVNSVIQPLNNKPTKPSSSERNGELLFTAISYRVRKTEQKASKGKEVSLL